MFGTRQNYRTESLDFDVAHISLPYNAILGYPALAKFMAVTHHAFNMVKIPGHDGIISVRGEVEDVVRSIERAFKELVVSHPSDEDYDGHLAEVPKKKLMFCPEATALKTPPMSIGGSGAGSTYRAAIPPSSGRNILLPAQSTVRPSKGHGEPQPKWVGKDSMKTPKGP